MSKKPVHQESLESDEWTDDALLDGILLGDYGREYHLSLKEQLLHLRNLKEVSDTIKLATGREDPELSVMNLLAYLTGQAAGMELNEQSATREESKCSPYPLAYTYCVSHSYCLLLVFYSLYYRKGDDGQAGFGQHFRKVQDEN